MFTDSLNLKSVSEPYFGGSIKVRLFVLILMTIIFCLPSIVQADGLFDFQMKLAKKGNAEAQFKVGEMYETGFGVKQDMKEAKSWIIKANEKGHETAGFKLLYWDVEKNGVTKANKANVETLKTKAKEGNAQAQYYVGKMYAHGVGVKRNSNKAISWLNKAALVGVLAAEQEIVQVRENQQRWILEKQRKDEKKRAEAKAKQESERLAKQKEQKEQEKLKAEAKARADKKAREAKAAADARSKASLEESYKAKMVAKREAEEKRLAAQKQALLKKREADKKERKTQFESDPCSGKSARFLSTCK